MNYCNPEGFEKEIKELLAKGDIDAFYHWFGGWGTKAASFEKGEDIFDRIIFPLAEKLLPEGFNTALDLGYGVGTKIQPAFKHFSVVFGIDVHDEAKFVAENLSVPKGKKLRLIKANGTNIPINKEAVDFVYSWATICHVGTVDNLKKYLEEIYKVLKPGGVAVLFFTRLMRPKGPQTWKEVEVHMEREREHTDGYREGGPLSKVRSVNFVVSMWKMVMLATDAGFTVEERTASWDDGPIRKVYHGQYGIVLSKPKPKEVPKPVIVARTGTTTTTLPKPVVPPKPKTSPKKRGGLKRRKKGE